MSGDGVPSHQSVAARPGYLRRGGNRGEPVMPGYQEKKRSVPEVMSAIEQEDEYEKKKLHSSFWPDLL
jgi:hypothetical protein